MEKISARRRRSSMPAKVAALHGLDLAKLGDGEVAYIREMSSDEAQKMFPTISGLPDGINIFALHGADGTPLALTDSWHAAMGHAMGDRLAVSRLN